MKVFITASISENDELGKNKDTIIDRQIDRLKGMVTLLIAEDFNVQFKITNLPMREES